MTSMATFIPHRSICVSKQIVLQKISAMVEFKIVRNLIKDETVNQWKNGRIDNTNNFLKCVKRKKPHSRLSQSMEYKRQEYSSPHQISEVFSCFW